MYGHVWWGFDPIKNPSYFSEISLYQGLFGSHILWPLIFKFIMKLSLKKIFKLLESKQYKYNTPDEFLYDYAIGVPINPKEDLHPLVLDFAISHRWDIEAMKNTLLKKKPKKT